MLWVEQGLIMLKQQQLPKTTSEFSPETKMLLNSILSRGKRIRI